MLGSATAIITMTAFDQVKMDEICAEAAGYIREERELALHGARPGPKLMPKISVLEFNREIIDATSDLACAYKPNLVFYEAMGIYGLRALGKTIAYIPKGIPITGDAKRGDIASSSEAYAKALCEIVGFDASTANPYLTYDSIAPFTAYVDKGVFILCKTSNARSADFKDSVRTTSVKLSHSHCSLALMSIALAILSYASLSYLYP